MNNKPSGYSVVGNSDIKTKLKQNFTKRKGPVQDKSKVCTSEMLENAYIGFRKIYLDLKDENPSWDDRDTVKYMYENDDDFAKFYDNYDLVCDAFLKEYHDEKFIKKLIQSLKLSENVPGWSLADTSRFMYGSLQKKNKK
jgi:hypothetical protein